MSVPVLEQGGLKIRFPSGRVGSSPTSGITRNTCKITDYSANKGKPRREHRGCLLQPYCNPSAKSILEGFRSLVLHVGEYVAVGVQRDSDAGVAQQALVGSVLG